MSFIENVHLRSNDFLRRLEVDAEDASEFTDHWNNRELLCLASAVKRSGDKNWVSVSRAIKPIAEPKYPTDWYTPKNCALQYSKLLKGVEESKRKPRQERVTSEELLVKNLTDKRLNELSWENQHLRNGGLTLKMDIDKIENGEFDDNLDIILKQLDEEEKRFDEDHKEWLTKRESLNLSKKLNTCRVPLSKGKIPISRSVDSRKKNVSPNPDQTEDSLTQIISLDPLTKIKIEPEDDNLSSKNFIKTEIDDSTISSKIFGDNKAQISLPSPHANPPTSPLLTSLLRSSSTSVSSVVSLPSKESNHCEISEPLKFSNNYELEASSNTKLKDSLLQNTPTSSPLLNSLLKSPTSNSSTPVTSLQTHQPKEAIIPKNASPPRTFFNPTSALATAAAQQLAVATSTLPQTLNSETSENTKLSTNVPFSLTSASVSAPTLSKLLEMPPSTPGKLPPLPVVDSALSSSEENAGNLLNQSSDNNNSEKINMSSLNIINKNLKLGAQENIFHSNKNEIKTPCEKEKYHAGNDEKLSKRNYLEADDTSQENIELLEAVFESINQAFQEKEFQPKGMRELNIEENSKIELKNLTLDNKASQDIFENSMADDDKKSKTKSESESIFIKADDTLEKLSDDILNSTSMQNIDKNENKNIIDEDTEICEKKFYKSRVVSKKRIPYEEELTLENITSQNSKDGIAIPETKVTKSVEKFDESKIFPASKKQRLFDKNEDEALQLSKRGNRRVKKGKSLISKVLTTKIDEPKDQYEFSESTEENSVGYQASNSLCYMPRMRDELHNDHFKTKHLLQDKFGLSPESNSQSKEKLDLEMPLSNKQKLQNISIKLEPKSTFTSDEDRMSDSLDISDEASNNSRTIEDKLKNWTEINIKQKATLKTLDNEFPIKFSKSFDPLQKKCHLFKKNSKDLKLETISKKDKKIAIDSDLEEMSLCSRDSEFDCDIKIKKEPLDTDEVEVDTNDSHLSASIHLESGKHIDETQGSESMQGSITTDFSPLPISGIKEEPSQTGKQEWFHGPSPKSAEAISQSSEDSDEYESDNSDSQSANINKSALLSTDKLRTRRKERETPQYKAWKKSISIVWREASCHKYANVFLQKVTNDVAPGYLSIVNRPMDLSLIKRNIDNGVIKTTNEFQRDMMLMFQNAIMYNSSDHDVYHMAVEMQRDVIKQIEDYVATQIAIERKIGEPPTTSLRAARKALKASAGIKIKEEIEIE